MFATLIGLSTILGDSTLLTGYYTSGNSLFVFLILYFLILGVFVVKYSNDYLKPAKRIQEI